MFEWNEQDVGKMSKWWNVKYVNRMNIDELRLHIGN